MKKTPNQITLPIAPTDTKPIDYDKQVDDATDDIKMAVRNAIQTLPGRKDEAAGYCRCRSGNLADALEGRDGRRLPIEWAIAIALRVGPAERDAIMQAIAKAAGYTVARVKTDAEAYAELRLAVVERFGQAGAELVRGCK